MIEYARLMTQADMLREKFGEDSRSPIDILAITQKIERLTIVYYPLGENISGMCIKGPEGNRLIAINSGMSLGRQRVSLAHEFYHLFYDDSMVAVCAKKTESGKNIEKDADMFASYFLMPEAALIDFSGKLASNHSDKNLTLENIIAIEQFFGVSHQTAVYRLMHTQFLTKKAGEEYVSKSVRRIAESLGYSSDLYKPLPKEKLYMTYGYYIHQVKQLLDKDIISPGEYERLLVDAFRADLVYENGNECDDLID